MPGNFVEQVEEGTIYMPVAWFVTSKPEEFAIMLYVTVMMSVGLKIKEKYWGKLKIACVYPINILKILLTTP